MNAKFEKISYEKKAFSLSTSVKVECKTDVPAEGFGVIAISPSVYGESFSAKEKKVNFGGRLIVSVVGVNAEGTFSGSECGTAFSDVINDERVRPDMTVTGKTEIVKCEPFYGSVISVSVTLNITMDVYESVKKDYLTGGEDIFTDACITGLTRSTGRFCSDSETEQEFEIGFPVEKALFHTETVGITSVRAGIGTVIVDGEIHAAVYLLQKSENGDIVKKNEVFPFRIETECEGAMPAMAAKSEVSVKNSRYDIEVDEETGSSKAVLTLTLSACSEAVIKEDALVPTDCFSDKKILNVTTEEITVPSFNYYNVFEQKFNERIPVLGEDDEGAKILTTFASPVTITDKTVEDGILKCSAVIKATSIIKTAGGVKAYSYEFPVEINEKLSESGDTSVGVYVSEITARLFSETEIECFGKIKTYVTIKTEEKVKIIAKVEEADDIPEKTAAISVYIPAEGEDLFGLSKRLRVSPEEISKTNPDLEFPLKGTERIVVYRQLKKE